MTPTWSDTAKLGAIATLQTALNLLSRKEIEQESKPTQIAAEEKITRPQANVLPAIRVLFAGQALIVAADSVVDFMAAIVIVYHVLWSIFAISQPKGSDVARLRIAQGVLSALGFSVAGTLLKSIALQTWPQIRLFAFVFVLRTMLKRFFAREESRIRSRLTPHEQHGSSMTYPLLLGS